MPYNIIVGRDDVDREKFGDKSSIFIGKQWVKMGQTSSLSNNIFLDVNRPHVILVSGKRGYGKSFTLSVMAEQMSLLPKEISNNLSCLMFDTMGVFWTMKYPNERDESLLKKWNLKPQGVNVNIFVPIGRFEEYKERGIPVDFSFSIKPSELNAEDWANVFEININDQVGILIERILERLKGKEFSIEDVIRFIREDVRAEKQVKDAAENRFLAANGWGIFSEHGTEIKDLIKPGKTSIIDTSAYTSENIKALVIGLICRKLLNERIAIRKQEEIDVINNEYKEKEMPLVWIMVDEAHSFLPKEGKTAATDALIQLLREGRQPGISLVLATQQPGEIHKDVMTQSDIIISHRITASPDIDALNNMMQTYSTGDLLNSMN